MGVVTLLTAEEYLNMPETPGKHELLDGEVISLPVANKFHNDISRSFEDLLRAALGRPRVWLVEGYRLRRGWLIPDVSAIWPDQPAGEWFEGAPMIAIEIVSRGNSAEDIQRKREAYLEEGAAEVWIVYPVSRVMDVFRKDGSYVRVVDVYDCASIGVQVELQKILPAARAARFARWAGQEAYPTYCRNAWVGFTAAACRAGK
jgi:Uma2 family endonuclease